MSNPFFTTLRDELVRVRREGRQPKAVHLHPERRKLIEAEWGTDHRDGRLFVEGVEILDDPTTGFDAYDFEYPV
jgi:hypothetical protein